MIIHVNADDFGWNGRCSKAILSSFDAGVITTTTACGNGEYIEEAIAEIADTPHRNKVGVHLVLTEGRPVTNRMRNCSRFCENGFFHYNFSRYSMLTREEKDIVYWEFIEQIHRIKRGGIRIHHIDSHHHIHNAPNIFPIVLKVAKDEKINGIRLLRNYGKIPVIKRIGKEIYNMKIRKNHCSYSTYFGSLQDYLSDRKKQKDSAILEIMVHPDFSSTGLLIDRAAEASYESPFGEQLSLLLEAIKAQGDMLLSFS